MDSSIFSSIFTSPSHKITIYFIVMEGNTSYKQSDLIMFF
ncbi:hypothetical protein CU005_1740 [Enterococcus faecium]|nr:hypothetical protein [Enterococcus faecium]MBK4809847.1 hypothetical protein [Enterococcus faecium]MBK4848484.1 hypothetical protein [Enterococcus faecium]MBK4864968.1 hypothetical protein [Enterococcus faecium]